MAQSVAWSDGLLPQQLQTTQLSEQLRDLDAHVYEQDSKIGQEPGPEGMSAQGVVLEPELVEGDQACHAARQCRQLVVAQCEHAQIREVRNSLWDDGKLVVVHPEFLQGRHASHLGGQRRQTVAVEVEERHRHAGQ